MKFATTRNLTLVILALTVLSYFGIQPPPLTMSYFLTNWFKMFLCLAWTFLGWCVLMYIKKYIKESFDPLKEKIEIQKIVINFLLQDSMARETVERKKEAFKKFLEKEYEYKTPEKRKEIVDDYFKMF